MRIWTSALTLCQQSALSKVSNICNPIPETFLLCSFLCFYGAMPSVSRHFGWCVFILSYVYVLFTNISQASHAMLFKTSMHGHWTCLTIGVTLNAKIPQSIICLVQAFLFLPCFFQLALPHWACTQECRVYTWSHILWTISVNSGVYGTYARVPRWPICNRTLSAALGHCGVFVSPSRTADTTMSKCERRMIEIKHV